mgnify:CR=1 FL=1
MNEKSYFEKKKEGKKKKKNEILHRPFNTKNKVIITISI